MDIQQIIDEAVEAVNAEDVPSVPMQPHCWDLSAKCAKAILRGMKKIIIDGDEEGGTQDVTAAFDLMGPLWSCQSLNEDFPCSNACCKRTIRITEAVQMERDRQRRFIENVEARLDAAKHRREVVRSLNAGNRRHKTGVKWT